MLSNTDKEKILELVKKEPRLVQDLAKALSKSWVTMDSYVSKIADDTGLIKTKTFRGGTQGAVKIVFWNYAEATGSNETKTRLFDQIKNAHTKEDFDPLEVFQFVAPNYATAIVEPFSLVPPKREQSLLQFFNRVENELLVFSGNFSFLRYPLVLDAFTALLKRGIRIKAVCRIDLGSAENLKRLETLLAQYPKQIEIRHSRQPIRGFIADGKTVRLKDEKNKTQFKESELAEDYRVFYEISDPDWVPWFQNVFWYLHRTGIPFDQRRESLKRIALE